MLDDSDLLSRQEAAAALTAVGLKTAPSTLAKHAMRGEGPAYVIAGNRAMYDRGALLAWAASRVRPSRSKGACATVSRRGGA